MPTIRVISLIGIAVLATSCAGYKESTQPDWRPSYDGPIDHWINGAPLIDSTISK
jgi:hypothetical protein